MEMVLVITAKRVLLVREIAFVLRFVVTVPAPARKTVILVRMIVAVVILVVVYYIRHLAVQTSQQKNALTTSLVIGIPLLKYVHGLKEFVKPLTPRKPPAKNMGVGGTLMHGVRE